VALLSEADIERSLKDVPAWTRGGSVLRRTMTFDSFAAAIAFVNRVAELADQVDHHPDIDIRYNAVTFVLSTHSAGGLTARDFALAAGIDRLRA
jgi:4a-hydroxytetrahydrobiopterin dehydratase